jgi:phospholipid/cholesterol/gamma-HCH transport system ATP-binding protein
MIEFQRISKTFNGKAVLDGVSGKFDRGKVNLVIGASGTGKSVLLKCIVGLLNPDQGNVMFDGADFTNGPRKLKVGIRKEMGMLFQSGALFDSKNVEENVLFPLDILTDMPKDAKMDRVNFCLQRVGLTNANKKMPSELSGGMQKRVGVARAIVNNSKYLFCDEPTSGLDARTGLLIDELIQELTYEYNITTTVVTHDMNSIVSMGDYILFLEQGRKAWEGTSADVFHVDVAVLKDFIFSSKLMRMVKKQV